VVVEHALLALLEIAVVKDVLKNVGCDVELLRRELATFIKNDTPLLSADAEQKTGPALGFQRVMQSAVFHMQFTEKGVSAPQAQN
jgi:ATP-dependent Clp protease ATP-binding subunit ClpA